MGKNTDNAYNLPTAADFQNTPGTYRPGGDAQHVSYLVQEIARDALNQANDGTFEIRGNVEADPEMVQAALELLPSDALRNKLRWAVKNIENGRSRVLRRVGTQAGFKFPRATRQPQNPTGEVKGYTETTVKKGRWEYPARKFADGSIERNTKRDGTGEWIAA